MKYILSIIITICFFFCSNSIPSENDRKFKKNLYLSKNDAERIKRKLYKKYSSDLVINRSQEIENKKIIIDNRELKYDLKFFGDKPKNGWSLYFSLHGGGGVAEAYNERQWNRHKKFHDLEEGILLTPRSPTNSWNMWHQEHIDIFFNRLIQNMIAANNVNPNRIYVMGYSAGGDGVYQLAPRMADRFAAAAMMAGHPNDANPLSMRNIAFAIHMGENDSLYNRNGVAIEWGNRLSELKKNDPGGFDYQIKIYEGKGHDISNVKAKAVLGEKGVGLDSLGISWLSNFSRDPYPKKVIWKQDDVVHNRFYWLKVNQPQKNSLIVARIDNQIITIEETTVDDIVIRVNDNILNMDKKVIIKYLGNKIFNDFVYRNRETIFNSIKEYGDPESIYFGEIPISLR